MLLAGFLSNGSAILRSSRIESKVLLRADKQGKPVAMMPLRGIRNRCAAGSFLHPATCATLRNANCAFDSLNVAISKRVGAHPFQPILIIEKWIFLDRCC